MAQLPNPPQFDKDEGEDIRVYKLRQFVDEMIRTLKALNDEIGSSSSSSSSRGYPPQLGHARI